MRARAAALKIVLFTGFYIEAFGELQAAALHQM